MNLDTCPAKTSFSDTAKAGSLQSCACPATAWLVQSNGTSASTNTPCLANVPFQDINPSQATSVTRAYLDYVNSLANTPHYPATVEGACDKPVSWTNPVTSTAMNAVVWHPGTMGDTELATLAQQSATTPGKGRSCGTAGVPIVFLPGTYRFTPTVGSGWEWKVGNGTKIYGGYPNAAGTDCDTTQGRGVQFQFANASFVRVYTGLMFLCGEGLKPVISAPLNTGTTDYYWAAGSSKNSNNTNAFLTMDTASNNGNPCTVVCFVAHGIVNAAAGWADMSLSGTGQYRFYSGAIFKAMKIGVNGSSVNGSDMAPPPLFDGDRYVQLRFWDKKNNKELGMVQIQIRDYFGQRIASGYKIVYWRLN